MNMKKVLVINGSRNYVSKGYKIISKIQKGLDSNKFEMVLFDPNKLQLEFCRGCKNCFNTGKCPLDLVSEISFISFIKSMYSLWCVYVWVLLNIPARSYSLQTVI